MPIAQLLQNKKKMTLMLVTLK